MQSEQPVRIKAGEPGPLGFHRRSDRLQPHEQPLPEVSDPGRIGWHERQPGTSSKRLPQSHSRMNAERLRGERHLPDVLRPSRFRRKRGRCLQKFHAVDGRDIELEAREEHADDH